MGPWPEGTEGLERGGRGGGLDILFLVSGIIKPRSSRLDGGIKT